MEKFETPVLKKRSRVFWMVFVVNLVLPNLISAQENAAAAPPPAKEKVTFKAYWHNGFTFESSDKNFELKFGGRIQTDWAFFSQPSEFDTLFGAIDNGVEFRRARFFNKGTVYKNLNYKIQFDFASGSAVFKDVYIGISDIPGIGNIRVGHFKEPLRLEVLTSSKYMTFMERAPSVAFVPERNVGIMIFNHAFHERFTWAGGVFRRSDKFGNDKVANDELNLTARFTFAPLYDKTKNQALHLGFAISHREPDNNEFQIKSKPEAYLAPTYVNTGTLENTDHLNIFQWEAAVVAGPFSAQGEYLLSREDALNAETQRQDKFSFSGFYGYASYFLTGESRKYKASSGSFGRVSPKKNFGPDGGYGAWEIGVRYSRIDLNDLSVSGGILSEWTVGLNWYLNPVSRVMLNYVNADLKDTGTTNLFETRFQIDF